MYRARTSTRSSALRVVAAFAASATLAAAAVIAPGGLSAVGSARADAQGGDTYVLSGFNISYPFVAGPRDGLGAAGGEESGDPTKAGVAFTAKWSGAAFPGQAWCEISVRDQSGGEMGLVRFLAAYATPTSLPPIIAVDVTGEPADAQGTCGPGSYPSGAGYGFDNLRLTGGPNPGQSEVSFDSHWLGESAPGWRSCAVVVEFASGEALTFDFGYHAPDDSTFTHVVDARPDDIAEAAATCTELGMSTAS